MSLGSAQNAAVAGLKAQSAAIAAVSENIANASTTAYKSREIQFQSLIASSSAASSLNQVGGGVTFQTGQNMTKQGLLQNTGVGTNIAINGQGFFVVTDDPLNQPSGFTYTRNGDFATNEDGLMINNEGMILLGQRTNEEGLVTAANKNDLNSLEPLDLNTISGTAQATGEIDFNMNLPANAVIGDVFLTAVEVFDALGVSHTITQNWEKIGANEWVVQYSDPVQTSTLNDLVPVVTGTIDVNTVIAGNQDAHRIIFNGDASISTIESGNFASPAFTPDGSGPQPADSVPVTLTGLAATTGATSPLTVAFDYGDEDLFNGVTQFASEKAVPDIDISLIEQDGVRFGQLSGVEINGDGLAIALFDNGVRRPIFQIPIATFPNPGGLTNVAGTVYDENENAGNLNLRLPGEGNAGDLNATSLELSTVDTSEEFNKMIVAQQAYSSAAQVISTVDEMFDSLLRAVA